VTSKPQQITNTAIYVLPLVVGNLVPIATLPIFTALLTPEDFGAWALAASYSSVVSGLAAAGLPIAFERNFFEQRDPHRRHQLLYSAMAFTAGSFAVCALVTWLLCAPISLWLMGQSGYEAVLVWSFGATAVVGVKAYFMTFLRNTEQAGPFAAYMIAERLLSAALSIALIAWAGVGVVGLVAGQLLAGLIVFLFMSVRFLRAAPPSFDGPLLVDALKVGYPLMPRVVFGAIGSNVDKYLIGLVASLGSVGIYTVGQRVANIAFTYMTALQNVFGPQVYARMFSDDPDARASIGRYLTPFAYVSTLLSFLIAVFSEEILRVLAKPAYIGAIPVVTILALYYAILFFGKMPQIAYARKTYLISVIGGVTTGLNIAFGAAGIWLLGTVGAAWGALAAGAVSTAITFIVGQRCFRIDWEARKVTAIFGLLFASAFMTIALRGAGVPYPVLAAAKLSAAAAFVWLGMRLDILTAENLRLVRDLVRRRTGRPRAVAM
jgi:O-antigen/teichoic acid export membrane protein